MNRRRLFAAVFFSVVIVAVLGVMVYIQRQSTEQTVTVYVLRHTVPAGGVYSTADVAVVPIRAQEGDFNYEHRGPEQYAARYTQNLRAADILRDDDLVDSARAVEIALTVQAPPPLSAGDRIDVFAGTAGGRQARIGQQLTVLTASGGALTILVPSADEAAWVAVASSSIPLHAVHAGHGSPSVLQPLSGADAVTQLCGSSCSGTAFPTTAP